MYFVYFIFLLFQFVSFTNEPKKLINSNSNKIKIVVDHMTVFSGWIDIKKKTEQIKAYCPNEENRGILISDLDSITFNIHMNDTINVLFAYEKKDTITLEIIGIREFPNTITKEDKLFWLSKIWSEISYNFVNTDLLQFDLDSLYQSYIPIVLNTETDYQFYQQLKRFAASLKDGHTAIYDGNQFYHYKDYVPVLFEDFNDKVYITKIRKDPSLDSTWLGAELIEIEAKSTIDYLESEIFPFVSASTKQSLWMQGLLKLHSDIRYRNFLGKIQKDDGSVIDIELEHNGESTKTDSTEYWGPDFERSREPVNLKWLSGNIALLSITRFSPEGKIIEELDKVVPELKTAKSLIIDLRKNYGGSTVAAIHLQKVLSKGNYFLNYGWQTRVNDGVRKANGNWQEEYKDYLMNCALRTEKPDTIFIDSNIERINCPVVILIGRATFSAAEDFLVNIYEVPNRPKLIGEETGGSTGSPLVVPGLPGGGYARICTRRICFPYTMKKFSNSGIRPDVEVHESIQDYLQSKDVVLEKALKILEN